MYIFIHLKNSLLNASLINKVQFCSGLLTKHGRNKLYSSFARTDTTKSFRQTNCGVTCKLSSKNKLFESMSLRFKHSDVFSEVNINIRNNVLLYKHADTYFYIILKMTSIMQIILLSIVAYITYHPSYKKIFNSLDTFKKVVDNNLPNFPVFVVAVILAPFLTCVVYFLCARSIKYVILNKGGETLTFVTHHLLPNKRTLTVPVKNVKTHYLVHDKKTILPLKIKGKSLYYLLDIQGKFINDHLFDNTIGIKKDW